MHIGIVVGAGLILMADVGDGTIGIDTFILGLHQKLCLVQILLIMEIKTKTGQLET